MAMISSITSLSFPPSGNFGIRKSRTIWCTGGWTIRITGTSNRLAKTRKTAKRSKRRKLPVLTAIITMAAEAITPQNCENPR